MTEDHCCTETRSRQVCREDQSHEEQLIHPSISDVTVEPPSIIEQQQDRLTAMMSEWTVSIRQPTVYTPTHTHTSQIYCAYTQHEMEHFQKH